MRAADVTVHGSGQTADATIDAMDDAALGTALAGEPESGASLAGAPMPGAPLAGAPLADEPESGAPLAGAPESGAPLDGAPESGAPLADEPVVSVIITTYGDPAPLDRAVRSALAQTLRSLEVIIVDDNGTGTPWGETTAKLVAEMTERLPDGGRIRYLQHDRNRNGAAARNTGIDAARGEFIAFLDNDDFYLADKLERSVRILREAGSSANGPVPSAVLDDVLLIDEAGRLGMVEIPEDSLEAKGFLLNEMALGTGSNLFLTRRAVEALGGFDEEFLRNQDIEFMLRFHRMFKAVRTRVPGVVKTTDGTSNAGSYEKMRAAREMIYRKFAPEIERLSAEERTRMLANDAAILLGIAIARGLDGEIRTQLARLEELVGTEGTRSSRMRAALKRNALTYRLGKAVNGMRLRRQSRQLWERLDEGTRAQCRPYLHASAAPSPPKTGEMRR